MLASVQSAAVQGIDAYGVTVEVDAPQGLPVWTIVGLAVGGVKESRERVAAALINSGFVVPHKRVTVNLAPADRRKEGTAFDLPIAIGILVATGQLPTAAVENVVIVGELGLDGSVSARAPRFPGPGRSVCAVDPIRARTGRRRLAAPRTGHAANRTDGRIAPPGPAAAAHRGGQSRAILSRPRLNFLSRFPIPPTASIRFIKAGSYDLKAALGLAIAGVPAVLLAAYIVKSLNLTAVRWLVTVVVLYTAVTMLATARHEKAAAVLPPGVEPRVLG